MLTRRELIKVGLGGALTAAAAAVIPPSLLEVLAGTATTTACGRLADIEHVVILIQENRAFDHYFGRYGGVRGFDDRSRGSAVFSQLWDPATGKRVLPFHIDTSIQPSRPGECTKDVEHQWKTQHDAWDGGALDRWVTSHLAANGPADAPLVMGYYERADLQLYYTLADLFTICDGYHCSVIGGTDINRIFSLTGTMDPDGFDGGAQFIDTRVNDRQSWYGKLGQGGRWITYPEVLQAKGVSWKVYATTDSQVENNLLAYFHAYSNPASPLFSRAFGSQNQGPALADLEAECAAGTLPQVSWVLPALNDSEHPPAPIEWGEDAVYRVLQALSSNPAVWAKTALFVTYDENGGFFDHVAPAVPPRGTPGEFLTGVKAGTPAYAETGNGTVLGPIGLGFRVPMLVISPFSRGGFVCSNRFDHTSLLRFLERRFGARIPTYDAAARTPGLTAWRRQVTGDLTAAFNFAGTPDTSVPIPAGAVPNRADPRVLAECTITGEPGNTVVSAFGTSYPVPQNQQMPTQEPRATVRRPSGLTGC